MRNGTGPRRRKQAPAAQAPTNTPIGTINGVPGSPSATITINGNQPTAAEIRRQITPEATKSTPYWPARIAPAKGAPTLPIITDDSGYGVPSTFGGVVPTPTFRPHRATGIALYQLSIRPRCVRRRAPRSSPGATIIRSAMGVIAEQATGYPGYDSVITKDKATVGRIMKDNGYHTAWFGKNHNTPEYQASQRDHSTNGRPAWVFEYFYGFMGGDTNQWEPGNLVRNQPRRSTPYVGKPGWNLMTAMTDEAIDYINQMNALSPDQPFLVNSRRARRMRRITRPRNGSTRSARCICSTAAGTSCAKRSTPTRSGSA